MEPSDRKKEDMTGFFLKLAFDMIIFQIDMKIAKNCEMRHGCSLKSTCDRGAPHPEPH